MVLVCCAATAISSPAQTLTTLATFDITDGAYPYGTLVQGLDGNFYGTTYEGGRNLCSNGCGTVFKVTPGGALTMLHAFVKTDSSNPLGALLLTSTGNLYGTTEGFASGNGAVFEITPEGTLTTLASFDDSDGSAPYAGLVQANNGNLYGTTALGGDGPHAAEAGTVFEITTSGALTTLHNFCFYSECGGVVGGYQPEAPLIQGTDGFLYGTTYYGGNEVNACRQMSCGTIFKIGYGGSLARLHAFNGSDGYSITAGLVQASDGNFYGTTEFGGTYDYGTLFKFTPGGTLTTLHNFDRVGVDGAYPYAGLVQGTDGNFYGTTTIGGGGPEGYGTVFKMTPEGTVTILHSFDKTDGAYPYAGLLQATDGNFYGTTTGNSGLHLYGTVFRLSVGLGPFVKTLPTAGNVGSSVIILGTDLTDATSVTFNGKAATFTVVSATEITTKVPSGASTGTVQVTTSNGKLSSNVPFRVP